MWLLPPLSVSLHQEPYLNSYGSGVYAGGNGEGRAVDADQLLAKPGRCYSFQSDNIFVYEHRTVSTVILH